MQELWLRAAQKAKTSRGGAICLRGIWTTYATPMWASKHKHPQCRATHVESVPAWEAPQSQIQSQMEFWKVVVNTFASGCLSRRSLRW